jgi:hypothetical protein
VAVVEDMSMKYSTFLAVFLWSVTSIAAESHDWLVSVDCSKLERVGDTIRVRENAMVVDTKWDGYSLHPGQTIQGGKLFQMVVEACKF